MALAKSVNGKFCLLLVILAGALLIIDLIIVNICLFYAFGFLQKLSPALEKGILKFAVVRSLVGMEEGGMNLIEQSTLSRLVFKSHKVPTEIRTNRTGDYLSFVDLDLTHKGEGSFIAKRMLSNPPGPEVWRLVVDIGANDGFMSSNSNFFIRLGWDAVLVEPLGKMIEQAKDNLARHMDPVSKGRPPNVTFVQAVVGDKDGYVEFALSDISSELGHILDKKHPKKRGQGTTKVKSLSVPSFVREYKIPRLFGILSIDTEGFGDKVLKQFLDLGFRPSYIIYEWMHLISPVIGLEDLRSLGYTFLTHRGFNHIFEYSINNDKLRRKMTHEL